MFGAVKPKWLANVSNNEKSFSSDTDGDEEDAGLLGRRNRYPRQRLTTIFLSIALLAFIVLSFVNVVAILRRLTEPKEHSPEEPVFVELSKRPMVHSTPKHHLNPQAVQQPLGRECGTTVEEAMANGCPFDVVSNLWTPARCYNSTFAEEALQGVEVGSEGGGIGAPEFGLAGFAWFEDEELTKPIDSAHDLEHFLAEQDRQGLPLEAYTHMSFHAAHCSYLARVATDGLHRLQRGETDVWVPEVATDPHHARHCEHVFGELYRLGQTGARRTRTGVGFGIAPCVRIG